MAKNRLNRSVKVKIVSLIEVTSDCCQYLKEKFTDLFSNTVYSKKNYLFYKNYV